MNLEERAKEFISKNREEAFRKVMRSEEPHPYYHADGNGFAVAYLNHETGQVEDTMKYDSLLKCMQALEALTGHRLTPGTIHNDDVPSEPETQEKLSE